MVFEWLVWVISRHFTSDHSTGGYATHSSRSFMFLATDSERPVAVIQDPIIGTAAFTLLTNETVFPEARDDGLALVNDDLMGSFAMRRTGFNRVDTILTFYIVKIRHHNNVDRIF